VGINPTFSLEGEGAECETYGAIIALAEETVKVLALRSPLWKRGAGGDFIKK